MNNIYIDCIHCGYLKLTQDDIQRYANKGNLAGVTCKNCNEEAHLVEHVKVEFYTVGMGYIKHVNFRDITSQELRKMLRDKVTS